MATRSCCSTPRTAVAGARSATSAQAPCRSTRRSSASATIHISWNCARPTVEPLQRIDAKQECRSLETTVPEQRSPDAPGENVIEIEMHLGNDADISAGRAGCRDDCLDSQLDLLARPDHAQVDRARVCSPKRPVVGDEKLNSTRGVSRLTHSGKPRSRTWKRRYNMLYWTANPYWT